MGYEGVYKQSLCFGMNDDDVTPQIEANGIIYTMSCTYYSCHFHLTRFCVLINQVII